MPRSTTVTCVYLPYYMVGVQVSQLVLRLSALKVAICTYLWYGIHTYMLLLTKTFATNVPFSIVPQTCVFTEADVALEERERERKNIASPSAMFVMPECAKKRREGEKKFFFWLDPTHPTSPLLLLLPLYPFLLPLLRLWKRNKMKNRERRKEATKKPTQKTRTFPNNKKAIENAQRYKKGSATA